MANQKVPQLPVLSAVTGEDLFYVVDVSDTTDDPTGSSKQINRDDVLRNINQLDFNNGLTPLPTDQEGRMYWDDDNGSISLGMHGGQVVQQIGLEHYYYIKNQSGATIDNGRVVRAAGTLGASGRILGEYMIADGTIPVKYTLGISTETIVDGDDGYVTEFGLVRGIDTTGTPYGETWNNGDILWVSPTIPGGLTKVEPSVPDLKIEMAIVVFADANGSIFVRPNRYPHLYDLQQVNYLPGTENDFDILQWNNATQGFDKTNTPKFVSVSANTITATTVVGSSMNINTTPTNNNTNTEVLSRNSSTGNIEYINSTYIASSNYSAGVISGATYTSTGTGQVNLPNIKVALYDNANNIAPIVVYDVASGTTGSGGIPSLVDQDTNYIVVEYNSGTPRYYVYDNDGPVNDSSVVLFMVVYRLGNFVHTLEFGNQGAGLANKLNDRFIMTDRFGWESGLMIELSGSTGVITLSAGVAWNGSYRQTLDGLNSQDDVFFKNYHSGGTWVYTTTGDTLNNTYYDNGTNIVTATAGKYLTNYYYRGQEVNDHLYEVYSTNEYDSVTEAEAATNPELPELITSHAFLVGRIIVQVGETTGITQTAFGTVFAPSGYAPSGGVHNDLSGLQGGTGGQYYHLTSDQYNNNAYTNVDNNFSTQQTFTDVKITGTLSGNTNSMSVDNLVIVGLLYLSNNT